MSAVLAHLVHRFGSHVRVNGRLCVSSNGDPALVSAFTALGWPDPCPVDRAFFNPKPEAAIVQAPERAVMPSAKGRIG